MGSYSGLKTAYLLQSVFWDFGRVLEFWAEGQWLKSVTFPSFGVRCVLNLFFYGLQNYIISGHWVPMIQKFLEISIFFQVPLLLHSLWMGFSLRFSISRCFYCAWFFSRVHNFKLLNLLAGTLHTLLALRCDVLVDQSLVFRIRLTWVTNIHFRNSLLHWTFYLHIVGGWIDVIVCG